MLSPVPSGSIHVRTGQDAVILKSLNEIIPRGGEGKEYRTAGARYLDCLPFWWPTAMVYLRRARQ